MKLGALSFIRYNWTLNILWSNGWFYHLHIVTVLVRDFNVAEFSTIKKHYCYIVSDGMCWTCLLLSGIYIYIYIYLMFDMSTIICLACVEMQKWTVDASEDFLETNFNPTNWDYNSIGVGVKLRIMMYIDFKIWLLTRSLWIGNLDQMSGSTYVFLILYVYILKILNQLSLYRELIELKCAYVHILYLSSESSRKKKKIG